ncbi:MAG: AraC family transcriptional regulator [Ruminococcaceae bacterium]|nr:AraC family transcriptional regulator [Oscillospiraceae bacterium]
MIAKFEKKISDDKGQVSFCKYKNLHNLFHWHIEHEIIFVSCGCVELYVDSELYTLTAGMCAFITSKEAHYICGSANSIIYIIKTSSAAIDQIIQDKRLKCPIIKTDSFIKRAFYEIENELRERKEYSDIIVDSIMNRAVAEIFRTEITGRKDVAKYQKEQYNKLLSWIAKNYTDISFEDAASYMNFSRSYFSKYFQNLVGMKFTQYINILKVSLAIDKITNGEKNMTNISISCGFGTIRNFNRVFKNLTGYTPKHLPDNYVFLYTISTGDNDGFDPTLSCSEIIK